MKLRLIKNGWREQDRPPPRALSRSFADWSGWAFPARGAFAPRISLPKTGEAAIMDLVPSLRPKPWSQAFVPANQAGLRSNFDHLVQKLPAFRPFREMGAHASTVIAIAVRNPQLFA